MNWLNLLPHWMGWPIQACLGPALDLPAGASFQTEVEGATYWGLLLAAMLAGLIGTYLGAWREKTAIKLGGYAAVLVFSGLFVLLGWRHVQETGGLGLSGNYAFALGNFSFWLVGALCLMPVALAVHHWAGRELGKVASTLFSEALSLICLFWLFYVFALHNCI